MAWPAIATNVTTPLLGLVDVAIVGHIGSAAYIGAVAVGGAMFNMLYWLFGFLRAGTSGLTSQAFGAGNSAGQIRVLVRSLCISAAVGLLLIVLSHPLGDLVLQFMDADGKTDALARAYFNVAILGAPGVLATYTLSGWFLGCQSSRPAMWMAIIANGMNIVLSLLFVFYLDMGIVGVGAGTAIAQWISLAVGAVLLWRQFCNNSGFRNTLWRRGLFAWREVRRLFSVNADIFLRTVCLIMVTLWFTHAGAREGAVVLAANALLMQLFMLFSYFMDGFAYAGEALAGKFAGAGCRSRLDVMARMLMRRGLYLALAASVLYFFAGEWIMSLLSKDADVVAKAAEYKIWAVLVPLSGFMSFLWDGIYIGLTQTRLMLVTMFVAMTVFYVTYFIAFPTLGNHGLWLAFILYLFTRGLMQQLLYRRATRHIIS